MLDEAAATPTIEQTNEIRNRAITARFDGRVQEGVQALEQATAILRG